MLVVACDIVEEDTVTVTSNDWSWFASLRLGALRNSSNSESTSSTRVVVGW